MASTINNGMQKVVGHHVDGGMQDTSISTMLETEDAIANIPIVVADGFGVQLAEKLEKLGVRNIKISSAFKKMHPY